MVHAGLRSVGAMLNGPDTLTSAILDVVGPQGTLLCYANWDQQYEDALNGKGYIPTELKQDIPSFDPLVSRASRDHGVVAEFVRTTICLITVIVQVRLLKSWSRKEGKF